MNPYKLLHEPKKEPKQNMHAHTYHDRCTNITHKNTKFFTSIKRTAYRMNIMRTIIYIQTVTHPTSPTSLITIINRKIFKPKQKKNKTKEEEESRSNEDRTKREYIYACQIEHEEGVSIFFLLVSL